MRLLLFCSLCLCASVVQSAEPTLRTVNVRGLQVGGTTTLILDGDDLGKAPKLLLPFPAKQTLNPKSTEKQATIEVALDATIAPGYYHLRIVTEGGVSLPAIIGVDKLPQKPLAKEAEALPIALHGTATGSTVTEAAFVGKAGLKVMVEVEAERLGSKLRPVVHLYTSKKLQLAWSWPTPSLLGDTRLEATLPEDGTYTVAVHDAEYAGAAPGFFRLKIGQWNYADRVFPPIVGTNAKSVELLGNTATKLELTSDRNPFQPLPWPAEGVWSGPRPYVETSSRPELLAEDGLSGMLKVGSFAISDRLTKPFEEIKFRVPVVPNTKVRFEVFAERLGSPLDVALVIRDDKDNVFARVEDGPGTLDPVLEYAVPDKVTAVFVGVVDTQGNVGPQAAFRLTVDPVSANGPPPDFRLFTPSQRMALPAGGRWVLPVFAERRGYLGRIELSASGLPSGVKLEGTAIAADGDGTLVTASGSLIEAAITAWKGRGDIALERPVFLKGHPLEKLQPWLATEVAIAATTARVAEFAVEWRGLPDTAGLVPALKQALPVKVTRLDPATTVRLTLLTSQTPQVDPNRAIRPEKPVELGAKISDGEVVALLPADLPAIGYDIAIQAELLSADKQRVLATAFTPVKRLPVRMPIAVKLSSPAKIDVKLDPKLPVNVEIKGEIVRSEGYTGEATVTLVGLPPGIAAPTLVVKAAETAFVLKLAVPPSIAPGETKGIKLSASAVTDPKQPNIRVKSRDIDLSLNVIK